MTVGIVNTIKELSNSKIQGLWKKALKSDLKGLNKIETLFVKIINDHRQPGNEELDFMHQTLDFKKFNSKKPEAIIHLKFHAIIESQIENRSPKEAHQFYQSMISQKCIHHEAVHLLGHIIGGFLFDVFECNEDFDLPEYKRLLKKLKKYSPEDIVQLLEEEYDSYEDGDDDDAPESFLEQIPSYEAEGQLDELIDEVNEEGIPVIITNDSGEKAFLVPYFLFSDMSGAPLEDEDFVDYDTNRPKGKVLPFPVPDAEDSQSDSPLPLDPEHPEVFQFKISLRGAKPPIWRRIQIPSDFTFWDFHLAIQNAMGWEDMHLHVFHHQPLKSGPLTRIGIPEDGLESSQLVDWKVRINEVISEATPFCNYCYDFGDDWIHSIELEKTLKRKKSAQYPICTTGRKACPPEDCGGVFGYQMMLTAYKDPEDEAHNDAVRELGEDFDPDRFDAKEVNFADSRKQWDATYGNEQISF